MSISSFLNIPRVMLVLAFGFTVAFAQEPKPTVSPSDPTGKSDGEVLRVKTDLIRTGVSVFDKKGNFVDDLKPEDFELRIDGKPVSISFFEAARKAANNNNVQGTTSLGGKTNSSPDSLGRRIVFFVDDVHLAVDSAKRTRKLLKDFVDTEMLPNDLVVIVSTSGRLGALQQFTSDKVALNAAIEKLTYNGEFGAADRSFPPMSEYEAMLIDRLDQDTVDRFVEMSVKEKFGTLNDPKLAAEIALEKKMAEVNTRARSRRVLTKAASITSGTYGGLEDTANAVAQMSGRKIMFFISDGFIVDPSANASYFLNRITNAAVRSNMVIYSLDAKGLEGNMPVGSISATYASEMPNGTANAISTQAGSNFESLDGLNVLARNTSGRLVTNTNNLKTSVSKALEEAAIYYLLAWEPEADTGNAEKLKRIEVVVKGRPDLKVLTYNGYLNESPKNTSLNITGMGDSKTTAPRTSKVSESVKTAAPVSPVEEDLNIALRSEVPKTSLQTAIVANYYEPSADGVSLAIALQIKGENIEFKENADKSEATIDALGAIYNSDGKKEAGFRETLGVVAPTASLSEIGRPNVYYNYQAKLKPGLYQVRVAVRDEKNGNLGSASQWIQIPDSSAKNLTLSSILLNERMKYDKSAQVPSFPASGDTKTTISVDKQFSKSSFLRYAVYIYNAAPGQGADVKPNLTAQLQIFRDKQLVASLPASQIVTDGQDAARLSYIAEIPLQSLTAGRYEMQITVNDQNSKKKAVQSANFEIQ